MHITSNDSDKNSVASCGYLPPLIPKSNMWRSKTVCVTARKSYTGNENPDGAPDNVIQAGSALHVHVTSVDIPVYVLITVHTKPFY
jgi:hypothetical protein